MHGSHCDAGWEAFAGENGAEERKVGVVHETKHGIDGASGWVYGKEAAHMIIICKETRLSVDHWRLEFGRFVARRAQIDEFDGAANGCGCDEKGRSRVSRGNVDDLAMVDWRS